MSPARPATGHQGGFALWLLLLLLASAASYTLWQGIGDSSERRRLTAQVSEQRQLAEIKASLIAYAAQNEREPGRLPCPAPDREGVSPLYNRDDCPSYAGYLPWKTLRLPRDGGQSEAVHYAVSPAFADDNPLTQLNSDTPGSLRLDGALQVALLILPRGTLDPGNGDGDADYHAGITAPADDITLPLGRQELMAAIEQRIANQLRRCLDRHRQDSANPGHDVPWPAPLSTDTFQGRVDSLFGRVPDTQPGNIDETLRTATLQLSDAKIALEFALTAEDAKAAADQLVVATRRTVSVIDRIFLAAVALQEASRQTRERYAPLANTLAQISRNSASFRVRSSEIAPTLSALQAADIPLLGALSENGFDLFSLELATQNAALRTRLDDFSVSPDSARRRALLNQTNLFRLRLLAYGGSPNPAIDQGIDLAYGLAVQAAAAARNAGTPAETVIALGNLLYAAHQDLAQTIAYFDSPVAPAEITERAQRLDIAHAALSASTSPLSALRPPLLSTRSVISPLPASDSAYSGSRQDILSRINDLLAISSTSAPNDGWTNEVPALTMRLRRLADDIRSAGDNIALSSLLGAAASLENSRTMPPSTLSTTRQLRDTINAIVYWADLGLLHADAIASAARRGFVGGVLASYDRDSAAYAEANRLLDTLEGQSGTLARIGEAIGTPSVTTQNAMNAAIAGSLVQLSTLLQAISDIDRHLDSTVSNAGTTTTWHGTECGFLNGNNWWASNHWKTLVFYQISPPSAGEGRLQVNQTNGLSQVVIASGAALAHQSRLPGISTSVEHYLEGANADPSRNGNATTPVATFIRQPVSATHNDKVAY